MMLKLKNSDFLMAKRSKRHPARQNKNRAGCMSGIISIFDFRHGRITRRLLSDHRTHMTESTMGPSYPTSDVNSVTDPEEIHLQVESQNGEKSETVQTRVKELMEEEMYGDQTGNLECDSHVTNQKHREKRLSRSFDSREFSINRQVTSQKTSQYRDLEDLMSELLLIHQKRNEEQISKSIERSNSLENERSNPRSDEPVTRKHRNFFRRRSKSHECISLYENNSPPPSSRINEVHNERSGSQFSFTEIKKRLKNAIRKDRRNLGCHERPVVDGTTGWSSPNRDHFYSERFSRISNGVKRRDGVSRLLESETKPRENQEFGDTSDRISNIYVEAKKQLSEMLSNGDEDPALMMGNLPKTLGKILSFPECNSVSLEYNSLSAGIGPRNEMEHSAVTLYPHGNSPMVNERQPFMRDDDSQEPEASDEVHDAEGILEIVKPPSPEEIEVLDVSDLIVEDELSCSPTASPTGSSLAINRKNEELESTADDRTGKPSPVSVLEPLLSDDDISPARMVSLSAEASIQPLRIRFEETITPAGNQETCIRNHVENEESAFEYIEAVLLASDINWDEFEKRWLSSVQILDQSLYDELQIFSSRPGHDQRLLFDSTNDILKEVCDRSLGFFPELSFAKPKVHPVPKGMNLINEVWERIESCLYSLYPHSLDQLVKKDLEVSKTWMDLRSETREIVIETEESIFEDMIDDALLSLTN